jgi:dCMP deaminase
MSIDEYYMRMLTLVASRSTCVRRAVGAIIVNDRNHILATGYNGVPRYMTHCIDEPCKGASDTPGDTSNCMAVHAEQNAILQCHDMWDAYTLYVSCTPCFVCAKMICNTNIRRIIVAHEYADKRAYDLFDDSHVEFVLFKPTPKVPVQMTSDELKSVGRLHYERLSDYETGTTIHEAKK